MDSPLLPNLRRPGAAAPDSPTMLADLSLSDALPDDSFGATPLPSHPQSSNSRHVGFAPSRDQSRVSQHDPMGGGSKGNGNKPRFSLFAAPRQTPSSSQNGIPSNMVNGDYDEDGLMDGDGDETLDAIQAKDGDDATIHGNAAPRVQSSAERDDKLRESLYELRKMNEVFEGFLKALEDAKSHNERLSARVHQTSELLDRYTAILGQSEHTARLLNNPNWTGADDDLAAVEAEEAARQAAFDAEEERRKALQERAAADARRKSEVEADRAKSGINGRGGAAGRGRGTATRGASTRGRGSGIPYAPTRAVSGPKPHTANGNPTGLKKPTTTTAGGGLGGKYGHVQSSGYGPGAKR